MQTHPIVLGLANKPKARHDNVFTQREYINGYDLGSEITAREKPHIDNKFSVNLTILNNVYCGQRDL